MTDRLTMSVQEAAEVLSISRNSAYQAVARGEIPSLKLGRRIVVPRLQLMRMLGVDATDTASEPE